MQYHVRALIRVVRWPSRWVNTRPRRPVFVQKRWQDEAPCNREPAAYLEGRLHYRDRARSAVADRCRCRQGTRRQGLPSIGFAVGPATGMKLAGLIALSDPPRKDSAALISELQGLGVRTVMVTGDAPATAAIVATAVGLDGAICPPGPIPDAVHPEQFAVFAGVLPEDKYKLVKSFQKGGQTVGMCGDGAVTRTEFEPLAILTPLFWITPRSRLATSGTLPLGGRGACDGR
jgi:hypothetical protein